MEGLNQEIEIIIKETGEKEEQLIVSSLHPQCRLAVNSRALRSHIRLAVFTFLTERMKI